MNIFTEMCFMARQTQNNFMSFWMRDKNQKLSSITRHNSVNPAIANRHRFRQLQDGGRRFNVVFVIFRWYKRSGLSVYDVVE